MDQLCLSFIGSRVFVEKAGERCGKAEGEDVVGRRVGGSAAAVLQIVAGPDGGIGLVKRKLSPIGRSKGATEEALLPRQVTLERWPYLPREDRVPGPAQVAQQHIEEDHVHRSEEHTSELQSLRHLVCRLL